MEQRRLELLSAEHGYWRQRMIMEERAASLSGGTSGAPGAGGAGAGGVSSSPDDDDMMDRGFASSEVRADMAGSLHACMHACSRAAA